ncbi:hypothetical protein [Actinomadura rubrisoli]|uniref:Uncharacterized protein n=1 Tax=Actinomadura rubrisoli TaxID=2530368 RepID=A0A4R5CFN2_9ACTN|nr:hypothetical protein [Actinomadura rubrisoli]TDD97220.1 hypothetical protein E1298_01935 [Actinomadura rubrisoli]
MSVDFAGIEGDIKQVAFSVYTNFGRKFELEDIEQEIALAVISKDGWFAGLSGSLLRERLRIVGYQYCEKERSRYLFYSDQYTYSSNEVRGLLGAYHSGDIRPDEKIDLENALEELSPRQKHVLSKKYGTPVKLSEYERKLANRAVKAIAHHINAYGVAKRGTPWEYDGPGARRVMGNAQSQAINSSYWES